MVSRPLHVNREVSFEYGVSSLKTRAHAYERKRTINIHKRIHSAVGRGD